MTLVKAGGARDSIAVSIAALQNDRLQKDSGHDMVGQGFAEGEASPFI